MQDPDTRPRIDGSLAHDEDGGRRREPATNKTGSRGLLRMTLPTATTLFPFESLIFPPSLLRMQLSTEPLSSKGAMDAPKALQSVMINRKDYYGRNCNPHFWFRREGLVVEVRACANGFLQVFSPPGGGRTTSAEARVVFPRRALQAPKGGRWFPTGRAISAEGGVAVHRGADHVELPRLARPKGCFVTSAEWS